MRQKQMIENRTWYCTLSTKVCEHLRDPRPRPERGGEGGGLTSMNEVTRRSAPISMETERVTISFTALCLIHASCILGTPT